MSKSNYLIILAVIILVLIFIFVFTRQSKTTTPPTNQLGKTINSSEAPIETVTILMQEETYTPVDLTIKKGTKVVFKNETTEPRWPASNLHPTHSIYPEFDPKRPVESGEEWSFVFNNTGSWKYHDHLAPLIRGTITVTE
jgi:hypothetical protein